MDLAGQVVLVTGGARRVGRAIVEELHRAGARVVIHHSASPAEAEALARSLDGTEALARSLDGAGSGERAVALTADLRQPEAPARLVAEVVARFGRIDALVSNAAGYARTPLDELTDEAWESMLALNLTAPMRLARAAVPAGVRAIVNVCDIAAWQPWPNYLAYSTSKAGLLHFTRCLAVELAPRVRVNAIAPGTVAFPDDWSEERRARQVARIPLARAGEPGDAARAVRYLLTEDYLTGVCLPVDGGAGLR